jgi:superfamily II DNA/RNA helicase
MDQAIVFASTQIECDALAVDLQQAGFSAVALHGALSQGLRNRRLMALRQGMVQILVATDVAARGIDVPTISHVFNFGLPMKAEDYVHRIGRTGRAGRDGLAVTFAEFRDRRKIFDIEAYTRQPIKAEVVPGLEPQQRAERPRDFDGPRRGAPGGGRFGGRGAPSGGRSFDRAPRPADNRERNDRPPQVWGAPAAGKPAEGRSFNDRNSRGPRVVGAGADRPDRAGPGAGKGFVPRDMKKRPAKGARSDN